MDQLLLEIGSEEIPAGYIEPALQALSFSLSQKLSQARIDHGDIRVFGTPRRLGLLIGDVVSRQRPLSTEIVGPPEKAGFDEKGNPTVAAKKFAERVGIPVGQIRVKETEKGRYLSAVVAEKGLATRSLLTAILPEVILSIPFPKTMRWGDLDIGFARPIRWILALLGSAVVSFDLGGIRSGRNTYGHRFANPGRIRVENPDGYLERLRSARVIADLKERRQAVESEVAQTAKTLGGRALPDPELVDTVKNLVEYPHSVAGRFESRFLEVPDPVLITAMREHQKYFAVIDENERLMPCFIAVNNTPVRDIGLVARGHERVLRARLEDAQFFYRSDLQASPDAWVEKLKSVLFQASLGSMYDKIQRVRKLAERIAEKAAFDPEVQRTAGRAAWLCKTDLVSHVVVEFPKLQGVMGKFYALAAGEPEEVAVAIEEHYRPTHSGGALPLSLAGAILGIADKIDSICGCFAVGLVPTGASDPYALRRQGIGIVQIMRDKGFSLSLQDLIEQSLVLFGDRVRGEPGETAEKVYNFIQNRVSHLLGEEGYSKDAVAAVLAASPDRIPDVWARVSALEKLRGQPDFEPLAAAFKRVVNIVRKADPTETGAAGHLEVNQALFEHSSERSLFEAFLAAQRHVGNHLHSGSYEALLLEIASLRGPVDAFFNDVMVMTDNAAVRRNRLALLACIGDLFSRIADFSKIST